MKKIVMSWVATNNDFHRDRSKGVQVDTSPNMNLHRHFWTDHDLHIILSGKEDDDPAALMLQSAIRKEFPDHPVEIQYMDLYDVIDIHEIKPKVERLIHRNRKHQIDIFWSPGTSIMQLAWYMVHSAGIAETRIFQGRPEWVLKPGEERFFETKFEKSPVPVSIMVRKEEPEKAKDPAYLITSSLDLIYERAQKIAAVENVTTLIRGESGSGKEHLARSIHHLSGRRNKPFLAVNCSALGDNLLESRLFGYRKGAFTGAEADRQGVFEEANGGTLFLDEIGDISAYMQQALLRVLQEGEIVPVGENSPRKVDVRIVAATNRDLESMCAAGDFRWDLYYRLVVTELEVPALRDRGEKELKEMLDFFLRKKAQKFSRTRLKLSRDVRQRLLSYPFPGNLRELENLVENLYVFAEGEVQLDDLPRRVLRSGQSNDMSLAQAEVRHIQKVLDFHHHNLSRSAKTLDIALNTLKKKMKENQMGKFAGGEA